MKKYIYILIAAIAAVVILGCTKEDLEGTLSSKSSKSTSGLVFKGGFATTKTAYSEIGDSSAELVWSADDAIGIFSYGSNETENVNVKADIDESTVGTASGTFIPEQEISASETFLVYYPYSEEVTLTDGIVHSEIAYEQSQEAAGDQQIGKNGFSYALASVEAGAEAVSFSLQHAMSYIRFVVSTTELADYQLHSVMLYDNNGVAALAGEFDFDVETGAITVDNTATPYARVSVEEDDFTATAGTQELYLTVFPGDYSASDFLVVVNYVNSDGNEVTIPMSLGKTLSLEAGTMYIIELSEVSTSLNACSWYEPTETRNLLGGWCYGPQNTYYVVTTSTLTSHEFDVKARGDFLQVTKPVYYGILSVAYTTSRSLLSIDGTSGYESNPEHTVSDDCTISVAFKSSNSKGAWGTVAIYDSEYNILWSYTFIAYNKSDAPYTVTYPNGYQLLDRPLGMYRSFSAFETNGWDGTPCWFQWGRKDAAPWSNSDRTEAYYAISVTEDMDIAYTIAHPGAKIAYTSASSGNWMYEQKNDLWGNPNDSDDNFNLEITGEKTIYDPCPEGYRVCDPVVLNYVKENCDSLAAGESNNPFGSSLTVLRVTLADDSYDYWPYLGGFYNSTTSWGNRSDSNSTSGYWYWSNSNSATTGKGAILFGNQMSSGWVTYTAVNKAYSAAIRCQVDEDESSSE